MHFPSSNSPKCLKKGRLFVVSGPSGAGKTTFCKIVREEISQLVYSVSYTTRVPRAGEKEGIDYYFVSEKKFKSGILRGDWIEWAEVHGNCYGTSLKFLQNHINMGKDILLDIDIQGVQDILKKYPEAITMFVMPSSLKILEERLRRRGTDDNASILKRLKNAKEEIKKRFFYKHIIINDDFEVAITEFIGCFR